jgi:parvulin-like peptidyl-prolyl isomerase
VILSRIPACALLALFALFAPFTLANPVRAVQDATPDAGAPASAPAPPGPEEARHIVLAYVDEHALTLDDALNAFQSSHTGHGMLVRGESALRELIGRLVERQLFLAEAASLGLGEDALVRAVLDAYHKNLVVQEYWKRAVNEQIHVSEQTVEAFYAKTDVALKLLLIETKERAECEALLREVAAGADMSALAASASIHASRSLGGSLPYVRRGEIEDALEDPVFGLEQPGALTPVLATSAGFAFARLVERSLNPTRLPREVALPQIRKILRDREEDRLRAAAEQELESQGSIVLDEATFAPAVLFDSGDPQAVVATAVGQSLSLSELRDALNLDALRERDAETVLGAARAVARDWAQRETIWKTSIANGLRSAEGIEQQLARRRDDVLMDQVCERYVYQDIDPSEDELRAYYEANRESSFTRPPERRLAYMVVATAAEAEALLARMRAGENFVELAKQLSIDRTSAVHGGRIGWIKQGELIEPVGARAFAAAKGAIEGPIETELGWFLVHVMDTREAELVPFTGARAAVQKRLRKERQREAFAKWAHALRERADIRIDDAGLRAGVEWLERQPNPKSKPLDPNSPHATPEGPSPLPARPGAQSVKQP